LRMFKQRMSFWALVRLAVALLGYIGFKLFDDKGPYGKKQRLVQATLDRPETE
jgi:hypothetical protein